MKKTIMKIDRESESFPDKLRYIKNPPGQLYCTGDISLLNRTAVGVVGSRKYTVYGKQVSLMVGKRLAESGLVVVSGLARGIDSYAHEGMLEVNGRGIAVIGSGINTLGPAGTVNLMNDILDAGGLVVSEYEPDMPATAYTFPARNRIISGLSAALVVVEANFNSGALITAQFANEQGKTVYCVPGNINSQFSMGSNLLIRDGAVPLVVIDDIARELDVMPDLSDEDCINLRLGEDEREIVDVIRQFNSVSPDTISSILNKKIAETNSLLTVLEIKGIIESYGGKVHMIV